MRGLGHAVIVEICVDADHSFHGTGDIGIPGMKLNNFEGRRLITKHYKGLRVVNGSALVTGLNTI